MPNDDKTGSDSQTFTQEQVKEMIDKAVTTAKQEVTAEYKDHIKKLNDENAAKRIELKDSKQVKKFIAEALGLNEEQVKETDIINSKIAEIVKANKELTEKFDAAEKKATLLEKRATAASLIKKAGLKDKAMNLVQLDAENLEDCVNKIAEEYPELKVNFNVGSSSNPGNLNNSSMPNPYKKETLNLTKQMLLEQNNPSLAAKFKAEAGIR